MLNFTDWTIVIIFYWKEGESLNSCTSPEFLASRLKLHLFFVQCVVGMWGEDLLASMANMWSVMNYSIIIVRWATQGEIIKCRKRILHLKWSYDRKAKRNNYSFCSCDASFSLMPSLRGCPRFVRRFSALWKWYNYLYLSLSPSALSIYLPLCNSEVHRNSYNTCKTHISRWITFPVFRTLLQQGSSFKEKWALSRMSAYISSG